MKKTITLFLVLTLSATAVAMAKDSNNRPINYCGLLAFNITTTQELTCQLTSIDDKEGMLSTPAASLEQKIISSETPLSFSISQDYFGAGAKLHFACSSMGTPSSPDKIMAIQSHQPICVFKAGVIRSTVLLGDATLTKIVNGRRGNKKTRHQGSVTWLLG